MSVVLLVDDEPGIGGLVRMCLADFAVEVVQASSIAEALDAARTHRPKAVLLDLQLDSEDGLDLMHVLREEDGLEDLPVIAFTVHDSREQEARARGVRDFVSKPFKAAELRDAVAEYLK